MTPFAGRLSRLSLQRMLIIRLLLTEVQEFIAQICWLCRQRMCHLFSPSLSSAALGNHFLTNQVLQTHAGASPYDTVLAQGYNQPFTSTGTS